jgi:hypothetical protein
VLPNLLEIEEIYKTKDKHETLSWFCLFGHLSVLAVNYFLFLSGFLWKPDLVAHFNKYQAMLNISFCLFTQKTLTPLQLST